MYRRFLNNNDYTSIITEEALQQLIRGREYRLAQAEESAEASIIEYLSERYEIEKELEIGKNIREYDRRINYPPQAHFYYENQMVQALTAISGCKTITNKHYWDELFEVPEDIEYPLYSQFANYSPGDIVRFGAIHYICTDYHGYDMNNIRIPTLIAWDMAPVYDWEANIPFNVWDVVKYEGEYYTLLSLDNIDLTIDPFQSDNWGKIAEYDPEYNEYEFNEHEYVVWKDTVWYPIMQPNSTPVILGENSRLHDPRNSNVKKHMLRLALYELHKLISPNNISSVRVTDYETSIKWLQDACKLRINPQIPRKVAEDKKPVTDWQTATFQAEYDPNKNPWQI